MNHFQAGILRIILLEAGAALLVVRRLGAARARRLGLAFVLLAAVAVASWTRFGDFHGDGSFVHRWEQVHFYFGAKYLPEVRYADIYKAILLADREASRHVGVTITRDLTTFDEIPVEKALEDAAEVRARFSDQRWAEFSADWVAMRDRGAPWHSILKDHGNTASPAWALIAAPIAKLVPCTAAGEKILAMMDVALLVVMFIVIFRTFGAKVFAVTLWIFCFVPFSFDMLFGSFLRWDWLFAIAMSLCAWKRGWTVTSGAFLGYAVMSKLFPVFFGLALAIKALEVLVRTRRVPARFLRFGAGAVVTCALAVAVSSAAFGGPSIWKDYGSRIAVSQRETYYPNQYSLKTVFIQLRYSTGAELADAPLTPLEIKQGRPDVPVHDQGAPLLVAQIALTLVLAWIVLRGDELSALAAGPFFVFVWLTVNSYYWNMLCFPALAWTAREERDRKGLAPLVALHALLMAFYFYQHLNRGGAEGYFVGCMIIVLIAVWAVSELRRRPRAA